MQELIQERRIALLPKFVQGYIETNDIIDFHNAMRQQDWHNTLNIIYGKHFEQPNAFTLRDVPESIRYLKSLLGSTFQIFITNIIFCYPPTDLSRCIY